MGYQRHKHRGEKTMNDGKCGTHTYDGYDQQKSDAILAEMKKLGFTVTGDNPWDIDTHKFGVKLRAQWDKSTEVLSVIVTDKSVLASCSAVWDKIDPVLGHAATLSADEIAQA